MTNQRDKLDWETEQALHGELFETARLDLDKVAQEYGFELSLVQDRNGTWFFLPLVPVDD